MGLVTTINPAGANRGSVVCMIDNNSYLLPPSLDGQVLTCLANAPDGSGLSWTTNVTANSLTVNVVTAETVNSTILTGARLALSAGLGLFSVVPPDSIQAFPGTADGTAADDATILNAVIQILINYGFCASS